MGRLLKVLIVAILCSLSSQAMIADGIHKRQDYIQFAKDHDHFKSVCYVFNHGQNGLQTGVLIAPDLVLTAAHGVMHEDPGSFKISVTFGDKINSLSTAAYKVKSVYIHPEYRHGRDHHSPKVDMAVLRLVRPVEGIKPVPLAARLELRPEDTFTIATFGGMDYWDTRDFDKRAFVLPEWDTVLLHGGDPDVLRTEKRLILGSIFFKPCEEFLCTAGLQDPESKQRGQRANWNWHHLGKPPYALAMPGTSGAPVFIRRNYRGKEKMFVLGLVSSFTHLSDTWFKNPQGRAEAEHLLRKNVAKVYNRYQTLFVLPYIATFDPPKPTDKRNAPIHLVIDPAIRQLIEQSSGN